MSDLLGLLGWLFSEGLDFLVPLLAIFAVALFVILLVSPFESLQWWAGWAGDVLPEPRSSDRRGGAAPAEPLAAPSPRGHYVVFLPGVGALGNRVDSWEQRLLDALSAVLQEAVVLAGVFPYTVRNDTLTERRDTAWFWRWLADLRDRRPSLVARLIDWRNLTQVFVSMDPRYGPIFNVGVAYKLEDNLVRHGYTIGSRVPVTVIGYSGSAQVALGAAPHLAHATGAPVTVVSLGGVVGDDPALATVRHLFHLQGTRDAEARLAAMAVPARWPIARRSRWNRALADGRLTVVHLEGMAHTGAGGYLDPDSFTADGRSFLDVTASTIVASVRHGAAAVSDRRAPSTETRRLHP